MDIKEEGRRLTDEELEQAGIELPEETDGIFFDRINKMIKEVLGEDPNAKKKDK